MLTKDGEGGGGPFSKFPLTFNLLQPGLRLSQLIIAKKNLRLRIGVQAFQHQKKRYILFTFSSLSLEKCESCFLMLKRSGERSRVGMYGKDENI